MATYNELFPDDPQEPFAPIQPGRVSQRLTNIREAGVRTALPGGALGGGFEDAFGDLLTSVPAAPAPQGNTEWKDYGKAAIAGVGDLGEAGAGAVEYGASKLAGEQITPFEQGFGDLAAAAGRGRRASAGFANNWFSSMSPEAQARAAREVLSLDPNNTIWQSGPSEFLSSVGLKMARSAPSSAVTLLPGALIMRAGMGAGSLVYLGASEGGLSLGSIASNIATEVEQAPEEELMQSPRYAELRSAMEPAEARRQLITEAQGMAPLYGGLIVGAISAAAGRYLEPVFTDKAAGVVSRFGRGFGSEGLQEAGQSGAEQMAQNAAARLYDQDRSLGEGVPEAVAQGALVGGATGGVLTSMLGPRPDAPVTGSPPSNDAVPDQPIPAGPETLSFQDVFGDIAPREPTQFDDNGQGLVPGPRLAPGAEPVAADVAAAIRAQAQQEQASFLQKPWPVAQLGMDLPQAQTAVSTQRQTTTMPTEQQPMFDERMRGRAPAPLVPTAAQPMVQDMSAPAGFGGALTPQQQDAEAARQNQLRGGSTRGDFFRQRAALMQEDARMAQDPATFRDENQIDMFPPEGPPQMPDEPSAEPVSDLLAQLDELNDPDSDRLGVYLSGANIDALRAAGTFESVRGVGVPLANFDGKGGTLIAKDRPIAEQLIALRDEGGDMQQVLGLATGAGFGKPAGANIAVQQRDEQGNVVRESLVASPEEADALADSFDTPGKEGVVLSADMAIKRRDMKLAAEAKAAAQERTGKKKYRAATDLIDREVLDPETNIALTTLARAATMNPNPEVREIAQDRLRRRAAEKQRQRTETSYESRTKIDTMTDEEVDRLSDEELGPVFREAADVASGSRVKRKRDDDTPHGEGRNELYVPDEPSRAAQEAGAINEFVVHGKTVEEIIAAHPTRSERIKLVHRVRRMLQRREHGGKSKTKPITATAVNKAQSKNDEPNMRRKGEFNPTNAFELAPPRELSKADMDKHNTRVREAYHKLGVTVQNLTDRAQGLAGEFEARWRQREGLGNPPHEARDAFYASAYLHTLNRYGQLLTQLRPRSVKGLKEVERYNKIVGDLNSLPADKFIKKLVGLTNAEINEQGNIIARVDPKVLGYASNRKKRRLAAAESVRKLEEKVKRAKRLHDIWHKDSKFNEFVAPLMQKLIGYVTHDTSLHSPTIERRGMGYVPTFNELRNLRFALRSFKQSNEEHLYKPLKDWFQRYGYKFDSDGDLVLARNAKEFSYSQPDKLLSKIAKGDLESPLPNDVVVDRAAFLGTPRNYNQKLNDLERKRVAELMSNERKRRAGMSQAQRNLEDIRLANKIERERRSHMTFEQRKAMEALDRHSPLYLDLMDISTDMPGVRGAAVAMADLLEANQDGTVSLTDLLKLASAKLAPDNAYQDIIQRLIALNMTDATVGWDRTGNIVSKGFAHYEQLPGPDGQHRSILINRPKFEFLRSTGRDPSLGFVHAIIHEATHAATVGAIRNNFAYSRAITTLIRHIKATAEASGMSIIDPALGKNNEQYYGLVGKPEEFIAEAFSNHRFQQFLKGIVFDQKRSVWRYMIDLVKRFLGLPETPQVSNALELVLATTDKLFTGELTNPSAGATEALHIDDVYSQGHVGNVIDKIMQSSRIIKDVRQKATNMLEMNKEGGSRFLLSALTMEQIKDFYYKSFGGSEGPLNAYMKAFFQRNADNSVNMEKADKLSREWTKLTEEHGAEQAVELSRIMTEGTLYGIHPNEPLTSNANESVKSATQKARHAELSKRFRAMNSDWKKLYSDTQQFYDESFKREVALVTLNALRGAADVPHGKYNERDIERLKLNTVDGLKKEFGDALTKDERALISRIAALPQNRVGPYFPLMRFGDYVVTAERVKASKTFSDRDAANEWGRAQQAEDPTLSVGYKVSDDQGSFTVTITEKEVRMAETPSEAQQNFAAMVAEYGAGNVSEPQLKAKIFSRGSTIESGAGLKTILSKLDGNPAAQAAIKDFYLRSLSDGAFRKREIKRANRRGVDYDTQHRTFASYAKSAAYYTSQLRFGWQMADALIDMQKYVEDTAKGEHTADISPIRMGEVVREINTRDKLTTDPMEVSKLVRGCTELSQFMMLTSPSYWMINLTQPYMVTLPWLTARSSAGEATAALVNAQKLIASPIVNQMLESKGGLKALWSKAGAEKAFTVLEQVEKHIEMRGGARGPEYIAMLKKLKSESIIDLSFVAELRDIAEGQNTSFMQKVLDASRIMAHLSEVNNRILTAVAAYDLYRNKGASVAEAEGFAKQAVSLTQFNYSSGNAPRLFQARGPLGQMGPLVFQFMKYPQHMYALLIDNMRTVMGGSPDTRKIAIKTLAGLFATHLAAGGLIGMTLQPVKWAIGLALAAFGDEDEPYTVKNALSGDTFDRMIREATSELFGTDAGEIMSAGLPRAAGVDLSSRMSLGSLYFIDLKTDSAETLLGSLLQSFGGPLMNLGAGFYRGAQYMSEGQMSKGREAFMPKGAKDIAKAVRFSNEGLTDATGKEIVGAKDMNPWEMFAQSIGFAPASIADKYEGRAAIKDAQRYDDSRRQTLLRRFQNADAGDRADIIREISAFNRANPEASISRSQLVKSTVEFRRREARVRRYGVDLRGADRAYAEAGAPYETD